LKKVYDGSVLPLWSLVDVETYCGVKVRCEIVEVRRMSSGAAYTVKPKEDKEDEFRRAGVPKGDWAAYFTAFDWQMHVVGPDAKVTEGAPSGSKVIRKPKNPERYVSS